MKTMLEILKERLPEGLEIIKVQDRTSSSQIQLLFRYRDIETRGTLQKTCAPGYAEINCDYTICSVMMAIALKAGDRRMAEHWRERLLSQNKPAEKEESSRIRNQSPHQCFVGQTYFRDGCRVFCIAAHEDAILILQYGQADQPINYVVCHRPELACGTLVWGAGDYFTIKNYEYAGRSNPMSAALADAMECLLCSTLLEFRFDPIEDEPSDQSVYVLIHGRLEPDELTEIEDSISSYLDSMSEYGFEKLVEDVMKAHASVSFRIISPEYTFHI